MRQLGDRGAAVFRLGRPTPSSKAGSSATVSFNRAHDQHLTKKAIPGRSTFASLDSQGRQPLGQHLTQGFDLVPPNGARSPFALGGSKHRRQTLGRNCTELRDVATVIPETCRRGSSPGRARHRARGRGDYARSSVVDSLPSGWSDRRWCRRLRSHAYATLVDGHDKYGLLVAASILGSLAAERRMARPKGNIRWTTKRARVASTGSKRQGTLLASERTAMARDRRRSRCQGQKRRRVAGVDFIGGGKMSIPMRRRKLPLVEDVSRYRYGCRLVARLTEAKGSWADLSAAPRGKAVARREAASSPQAPSEISSWRAAAAAGTAAVCYTAVHPSVTSAFTDGWGVISSQSGEGLRPPLSMPDVLRQTARRDGFGFGGWRDKGAGSFPTSAPHLARHGAILFGDSCRWTSRLWPATDFENAAPSCRDRVAGLPSRGSSWRCAC